MPSRTRSTGFSVTSVGDEGIRLTSSAEQLVDVTFDGRRIWSFWALRDGAPEDGGVFLRWPKPLRPYLHGTTELALVDPGTGESLHTESIHLGDGAERIAVVNPAGRPLALDKSLKLVQTFDSRDAVHVAPLLDAIEEVLGALKAAGIDAFLAYGTALGAVRDGRLIGHDSDADLGYVSRHQHPVDVVRESFRVQRTLRAMGYRVTRYSAIAIKVHVTESDGLDRGLDVFGGFMRDGVLYLMGELAIPFERAWIEPFGTATLEGREFPVPADTDAFLTATYGPRWRVPDPAFKFETSEETIERFNGWFRGMRKGRAGWHAYVRRVQDQPLRPSRTAHVVAERHPGATVVDVGCGRGADVGFFADQGMRAVGLDYQPFAFAAEAERRGGDPSVQFQLLNLYELRQVLAVPAWVARMPGPRVVQCVHVLEKLTRQGRLNMLRASRMMLAGTDGRLYVQFLTRRGRDGYGRRIGTGRTFDPRVLAADVARAGGRVVETVHEDVSVEERSSQICRMVIEWES